MPTTPAEFAAAGLDHSVQLYQLTLQIKRLRATVQRLWVWTGVLVLLALFGVAYGRWMPAAQLAGRTLVLEGAGATRYTIRPAAAGLGLEVRADGGAEEWLLRTDKSQLAIEKDGRVLWASP